MHQQNLSTSNQYLTSSHLSKLSQLHKLQSTSSKLNSCYIFSLQLLLSWLYWFSSARQSGQLPPEHTAHCSREIQTRASELDKTSKKTDTRKMFDLLKGKRFVKRDYAYALEPTNTFSFQVVDLLFFKQ